MYHLDITFSPVNEMVSSLHTFLCKSSHKRIDLGAEWPQNVQASLSSEFVKELDNTEINLEWKLLYLLVYVSPNKDSVKDFLLWLKGLSLGELYEIMSPYIQTFPGDLRAARDRLHRILSVWNRDYFSHIDPSILSALQAEAEEKPNLNGLNAYEKAAALTNGLCFEPVKGLDKLVLVPQYHFQPSHIMFYFGNVCICYYAARIDLSEKEEDEPSLQMYRLLRSLSEKSRLRILHFLRNEPHTFIEVVRHLNISKGITHDHISNLRSAGLLNTHITGENVSSYSLRIERIKQIEETLLDYLGIDLLGKN